MITHTCLTPDQLRQVQAQIFLHEKYTDPLLLDPIPLGPSTKLEGLIIHPGVLRPMSSKRLAAHIYRNRALFQGRSVIDMGSGCGIQGIAAAMAGARRVILSDLTIEAVNNCEKNVQRLGLSHICEVRKGDLFEDVHESADIVVFAQPYFSSDPDPQLPFTYGMLDSGDLIHRFLEEAKNYCEDRVFMCHLDLAGDVNNPALQGPKHDYRLVKHPAELLTTGEQKGWFSVVELVRGAD